MMSDEDLTPRERRALQAKKRGPRISINWSKLAVPLVVVALLGLVFGMVYYQATAEAKCPGHWHSSFHVYVDDPETGEPQRINFDLPKYKLASPQEPPEASLPLSMHMHSGDQGQQVHWEPRPAECNGFGDFARLVDMHLRPGSLTLDGLHEQIGQGYQLRNGDNNGTLRAWYAPGFEDDWKSISINRLDDRQPRDCERNLIYFGAGGDDVVADLQSRVQPPAQCRGQGPSH